MALSSNLDGICALIVCCQWKNSSWFSTNSVSNVPGTAAPRKSGRREPETATLRTFFQSSCFAPLKFVGNQEYLGQEILGRLNFDLEKWVVLA